MKIRKKPIAIITFIIVIIVAKYLWDENKQKKIDAENKIKMAYTVNR
jgi:hypothetical protein